jgi:hypothetical protein
MKHAISRIKGLARALHLRDLEIDTPGTSSPGAPGRPDIDAHSVEVKTRNNAGVRGGRPRAGRPKPCTAVNSQAAASPAAPQVAVSGRSNV